MNNRNVRAVDLDGTLAMDLPRTDEFEIGPPVPEMVQRVKDWVTNGEEVWIFTARLSGTSDSERMTSAIQDWLEANELPRLPVTNRKSGRIRVYYDDRAVAVVPNTGHTLNEPLRQEEE